LYLLSEKKQKPGKKMRRICLLFINFNEMPLAINITFKVRQTVFQR
jgi:hypothetical protein